MVDNVCYLVLWVAVCEHFLLENHDLGWTIHQINRHKKKLSDLWQHFTLRTRGRSHAGNNSVGHRITFTIGRKGILTLSSSNNWRFNVRSAHSNSCFVRNFCFVCRTEDGPIKQSYSMMAMLMDTRLLLRKVQYLRNVTPKRNRVKEKWVCNT